MYEELVRYNLTNSHESVALLMATEEVINGNLHLLPRFRLGGLFSIFPEYFTK